jgi:hypothetical protein
VGVAQKMSKQMRIDTDIRLDFEADIEGGGFVRHSRQLLTSDGEISQEIESFDTFGPASPLFLDFLPQRTLIICDWTETAWTE